MKSAYPSKIVEKIKRRLNMSMRVYNRALRIRWEGWFFLGFIFAVGIGALNTGNNLLYLILAVMLGTVSSSGILSELIVKDLKLERTLPPEVWAQKQFGIYYSLLNPKKRITSYGIRIEEPALEAVREAFFTELPPGRRSIADGLYMAPKRGRLKLAEVRLATIFPFGFFEKMKLVKFKDEIIVYPNPSEDFAAIESGTDYGKSDNLGALGDGPDLYAIRPYADGDSIRKIHWKASAKSPTLVSKMTRSENIPSLAVVLDTSAYRPKENEAELETAISEATGIALKFIDAGFMVRLVTSEADIPYGAGREHLRNILTHLALFAPKEKPLPAFAIRPNENKIIVGFRSV